jgi:outer membrane lipoprotein SlyB
MRNARAAKHTATAGLRACAVRASFSGSVYTAADGRVNREEIFGKAVEQSGPETIWGIILLRHLSEATEEIHEKCQWQ